MWRVSSPEHGLRLLRAEATLSYLTFFMPIITVFYTNEIGMDFAQIGYVQAAYTAAVLLLQIPCGYLADRYSAKWCNISGDIVAAAGFVVYAFADSFWWVVVAEIIWALGISLSDGADASLIQRYTDRIDQRQPKRAVTLTADARFSVVMSDIAALSRFCQAGAFLIGGLIGTLVDLRLAVGMSCLTLLVGAFLASRVEDIVVRDASAAVQSVGERFREAGAEIKSVVRYSLVRPRLRWRMVGLALITETTTATGWILTPLLLIAGVPGWFVAGAWVMTNLTEAAGSYCAGGIRSRRQRTEKPRTVTFLFGVSAACLLFASALLASGVNRYTIGFYLLISFARGWTNALIAPFVQSIVPRTMTAMVKSVYATLAAMCYVVIVVVLGQIGRHDPVRELWGSAIIGAVVVLVWCQIARYERRVEER